MALVVVGVLKAVRVQAAVSTEHRDFDQGPYAVAEKKHLAAPATARSWCYMQNLLAVLHLPRCSLACSPGLGPVAHRAPEPGPTPVPSLLRHRRHLLRIMQRARPHGPGQHQWGAAAGRTATRRPGCRPMPTPGRRLGPGLQSRCQCGTLNGCLRVAAPTGMPRGACIILCCCVRIGFCDFSIGRLLCGCFLGLASACCRPATCLAATRGGPQVPPTHYVVVPMYEAVA